MISYTRTVLEPLVTALERSQAIVREQAETIGRLTAELDSERAARSQTQQEGRTAPLPVEPTTEPRFGLSPRLWLALLAVAGVVLLVALLVWPR